MASEETEKSENRRFLQSSAFQATSSREGPEKDGETSSESAGTHLPAFLDLCSEGKKEEEWNNDKFEVVGLVSEEPYSEIYKVKHKETGELAFLQASRQHYQYKSKYLSEEYIWKKASKHPHIVKLYFTYFVENSKFYVFEYLSVGTLRNFMKIHKTLRTGVAELLTAQIASAVEYLHSKDIFHRNVSNRNIMLSAYGQAKLSNFRHALTLNGARVPESIPEINKTSRGVHRDLYYQAPEVFSGKIYDQTADWYSLGVCLYEMVMGMTPVEYHCIRKDIDFKKLDYTGKIVVMLTCSVYIPKMFPKHLKSILEGLLQENSGTRLGSKENIEAIQNHPFFCHVDWEEIEMGLSKVNLPSLDILPPKLC